MSEVEIVKKRGRPKKMVQAPPAWTADLTKPVQQDTRPVSQAEKGSPSASASKTLLSAGSVNQERLYNAQVEIDHDLFKLEVGLLKRDVGYNPDSPIWEMIEHCHFFHSVDSRGAPQSRSTMVGGHYHEIYVDASGNTQCSPPMAEIKFRKNGRTQTQTRPLPHDSHTHVVSYRHSLKFKPQSLHPEFVKMQSKLISAEVAALGQKIPDVIDNG